MSCRCKTINLAVESIDALKKMENRLQRYPEFKVKPSNVCGGQERMPAPPGQVSRKKIMVCRARPVQFQCPPVPCVCPPCPPCATYTERTINLMKAGIKVFILYCILKWTTNQKLWEGHNGTAKFTLEFMEKNFPSKTGSLALPSMQSVKYKILNAWDRAFGTLFYYVFALPVKIISKATDGIAQDDRKTNEKEACQECPS